MQRLFCLFLSLVCLSISYSQEILSNLSYNPVVAEKWQQLQKQKSYFKTNSVTDTIEIPFLDDFSKNSVYPDTAWWMDQNVYINRDFPIAPITVGVATFDGLNSSGLPYDWTMQEPNNAIADTLTSKAINLGPPLTANDSIYLSFYYQTGGHGDAIHEAKDSLILEFKSPTSNWTKVWYKNDYTPAADDTSFHLVMIPITNLAYLIKGFQFRFKNYATLSGNVDHWHIDYVYLNKSRSIGDTVRNDVAFVYSPPTLLSSYHAMPWEQYSSSEMAADIKMFIRNNDKNPENTNYKYFVKDKTGAILSTYNGGSTNVNTFPPYDNYPPHASPAVSYSFPSLSDTATFFIEHDLIFPDDDTLNNTITYYQNFQNYFAYDDGTAEKSYALNQSFSYLAYKFSLNNSDTLKAFQAFFNPVYDNVSEGGAKEIPIKIIVWNDNNGIPGSIIYQADTVVYPVYEPGHNSFHTFKIDTAGIALGAGAFYIGWQQINSNYIRVGYDVNTNSKTNIFYNLGSGWLSSIYKGSLMIRPVMKRIYSSGIEDNDSKRSAAQKINIYPNPANEYVQLGSTSDFYKDQLAIIYDMFGRTIMEERLDHYPKIIYTNALSNGIYLIKIQDKNQKIIQINKLLVAH